MVADKIKLNGAIMRLALLKTGLHGKTISRRPGSKTSSTGTWIDRHRSGPPIIIQGDDSASARRRPETHEYRKNTKEQITSLSRDRGSTAKYIFLNFTRCSLRKLREERDALWGLKMRQMISCELSQLFLSCRSTCFQDNGGLRRLWSSTITLVNLIFIMSCL